MTRFKPGLEIPAYLALALGCAWLSNALAGPTRRLSWHLKEPTRTALAGLPATTSMAPVAIPDSVLSTSDHPSEKAARPLQLLKTVAPSSVTPVAAKAELTTRFPPLVKEAQAAIRGDEAVWLHAHGAVFLDARRTAMYAEGHIPGAKTFSAWEDGLTEKVDQLSLFTADLKLPIVIYCSGGDCRDSHLVAQKLWLAGFRNLRIYTDGYPDWEARKQAVAKGEQP